MYVNDTSIQNSWKNEAKQRSGAWLPFRWGSTCLAEPGWTGPYRWPNRELNGNSCWRKNTVELNGVDEKTPVEPPVQLTVDEKTHPRWSCRKATGWRIWSINLVCTGWGITVWPCWVVVISVGLGEGHRCHQFPSSPMRCRSANPNSPPRTRRLMSLKSNTGKE